jgi:hypothetical protein
MIHHIVLFKITEFDDELDRQKKIEELKSIFEKVPSKIPAIKSYEVGANINTSSAAYDVAINSTFRSTDDLKTYILHPDHQYAVEKAGTIPKIKVIVDYEVHRNRTSSERSRKKEIES